MAKVYTGESGISSFLGGIGKTGGMSMSNLYAVKFELDTTKNKLLLADLKDIGFINLNGNDGAYAMLTMLCEEASLPGMQANTGQMTGVYMGEGQVNYAHTKSFTDITFGWTCDANLLPLKFVNMWLSRHVFNEGKPGFSDRLTATHVRYPEEYMCPKITITKAERNSKETLGRVGGIYTLHDAWPYSIQSTPVSYGASTLLKVTASFYYRKWSFDPEDIQKSPK